MDFWKSNPFEDIQKFIIVFGNLVFLELFAFMFLLLQYIIYSYSYTISQTLAPLNF
jgi:hypothetical protein